MRNYFGWASICFAGGLFGGLVNSFLLWVAGVYGWTAALDVNLAPQWTLAWLYPRLVWGGLWGLLFLPRILANSFFWRGLLLSLPPTLVQLLVVFPEQMGSGLWGLNLGNLTPVVVVVANAVWGWAAALWVLLADDDRKMYGRRLR
jgi:hypothetical protein